MSVIYLGIFYTAHLLYLTIKSKGVPHFQRYIGAVLYILIFFYMSIASTCLSYLGCHTVAGISINVNDPNVLCDSDEYKKFSIWVYFIFLSYIILFPLGIFIFLFWGWKKNKLQETHFSKNYGTLYSTYTKHFFWWEDIVLLRKIALVTIHVFISTSLYKQVNRGVLQY